MADKTNAADNQAANADAVATATAAAINAFKARSKEVKASEAYKGNEAQAEHMIDNTDLPAADIIATLEKAPKAAASEPTPPTDPDGYDKQRTLAQGLAQPSGEPDRQSKESPWKSVVAKGNARMKKKS